MSNPAVAEARTPTPDVLNVYVRNMATVRIMQNDGATNSTPSTASGSHAIDVYLGSILDNHLNEEAVATSDGAHPPAGAAIAAAGGDSRAETGAQTDALRPATPLLRVKLTELSASSSDSEGDDTQLAVVGTGVAVTVETRQAASPPPNCAICLGRCKNKCFTDSCMHQFCFKCLCEWSKVKPECPLCKQTFKSIIHNVKSMDQFEEYHVQPPTVQIPHRPIEVSYRQLPYIFTDSVEPHNWESSRRSNSSHRIMNPGNFYSQFIQSGASGSTVANNGGGTSSTGSANNNGVAVQNQFLHRSELLDMYRQEAHDDIASSGALSQLWRRFIYDRKLYALPVCDITGRFRESSARFYRENPAQVHRLMPWINRDIVCLLRNNEHVTASTVLERINEMLVQTNILSPAFRRRLQPYLCSKTSHFIHELNNFARSPYDMIGYDRAVQYLPHPAEEIVIEFSSSGSSDEGNSNEAEHNTESVRRNEYRVQSRTANAANSQPPMVNLLSFTISTTSEGTEAPGVTVAVSGRNTQSTAINLTTHNRAGSPIIDLEELELMETARNANASSTQSPVSERITDVMPVVSENIELTSSSSDECEFVLERKPPHLRTPELVSLNSESDSDVVFMGETVYSVSEDEQNNTSKRACGNERTNKFSRATTSTAQATNATVKNEHELYNEGASTSTGLRSSGGARGLRSLREQSRSSTRQLRQKHSLRSTKEERNTTRKCKWKGSESSNSTSDSESSETSESDDEDYVVKRRHSKSKRGSDKKRVARPTRKPTRKRRASKSNESNRSRKRNYSKDNEHAVTKKHKPDNKSHSEYSSDEDDGQSLIELKKRLQEMKKDRGKEADWHASRVDIGSDNNQQEQDRSDAPEAKSSGSNISHYSKHESDNNGEATVSTAAGHNAEESSTGGVEHSDNEPNCDDTNCSVELSCRHQDSAVVPEEELDEVLHSHSINSNFANVDTGAVPVDSRADAEPTAAEEENTFSSVTQTTAATTTVTTTSATTKNSEHIRTHSRTSEQSFPTTTRTTTTSDNSASSTSSSSTSMSSPSVYSASSGGEEDTVEAINNDNNANAANQLGLELLYNHAFPEESWLMNDELENAVSESDGEQNEQSQHSDWMSSLTASPTHSQHTVNETAVALTDFSNACTLLTNTRGSLLSLTDAASSTDAEQENA